MAESCFICDKHAGRIETSGTCIYEDELIFIGHIDKQGKPAYLGHIMLDIKRHASKLADLTDAEAAAVGIAMQRISRSLMEVEGAEHVYALVSGNAVPHFHLHLTARYPDTPGEYWGPMEVYDWPEAPMGTSVEITALCERLFNFIRPMYHE